MEDENIIALYWERCETAIRETQTKYGRLCRTIVGRVLSSREDTEECLDDVYVALWDSIPPQRPVSLPAYIGKTARNTALKRLEYYTAKKRSAAILSLEELGDCVSGGGNPDETAGIADHSLADTISVFLRGLDEEKRGVFLRRYWFFDSIREISDRFGISESKAASMLMRIRGKLKQYLEKEGFTL